MLIRGSDLIFLFSSGRCIGHEQYCVYPINKFLLMNTSRLLFFIRFDCKFVMLFFLSFCVTKIGF